MEDYKFFKFFINNKLVTAVLCFRSHICNQAARIRVTNFFSVKKNCLSNKIMLATSFLVMSSSLINAIKMTGFEPRGQPILLPTSVTYSNLHCKQVIVFPVPCRVVTNQTLPGWELFNFNYL